MSRGMDMEKVIYLTKEYIHKTPEGEVMDKLKLNKMCCRRHLLTHVDIEWMHSQNHTDCILIGTLLWTKSFSTMDKHIDNVVYLNVVGKMPWMHDVMDAHKSLAAFFVDSIKFDK